MAAGTIHMAGGNNVTLSTATAASITSVTVSAFNQSAQTQNLVDVTLSGNTAGALALVSSGTLTLAGGNNITLSQAGNAVTISGAAAGGAQTAISGIQNSETTYTSGTVNLSVVGGPITIRSTTGQAFQFSVGTQTVQAETQTFIGGLKNTETTYTSGTVELEGTNNITVFSTTGQRFRISGANTHAQQTAISGISNSETNYTSGVVNLVDLANITIRSTTGQKFEFSVAAPAAGTVMSIGVSTGGNTEGNTTVNAGSRFVFVGSNMISLSQATGANSTTITIKATQSVQTQGVLSVGLSTGGNTAGDTTVNTGSRFVFSGQSNVTLSEVTAAGATTLGISAAGGGGGNFSGGVSNLGNTAGSTAITGTQNVHVGTHHLTLSQSTGANGATITHVPGPNLNIWNNFRPVGTLQAIQTTEHSGLNRSWGVFPLMHYEPFPGLMTVNTLYMKLSVSGSTATMSLAATTSFSFALYTLNASTLSLLNSASTSFGYGAAATNNSTGWAGNRWLTLHSSLWSVQPVLSQAQYWIATAYASAGASNQTLGLYGMRAHASQSVSHLGTLGVATVAAATSQGYGPFWPGYYTATSASPPASIGSNQVSRSFMMHIPYLVFQRDGPQTW